MVRRKSRKSFLASTTITLLIVAMLLFSGPAQAVSVVIFGLEPSYTKGNEIKFQVQININDPDQFVPINDITLNITGASTKSRVFTLDGSPISGDTIIKIKKVQGPVPLDFGYGYGYGSVGYGYGNFGYGSVGYGYDNSGPGSVGYGYSNFGYGYNEFGYGYRLD